MSLNNFSSIFQCYLSDGPSIPIMSKSANFAHFESTQVSGEWNVRLKASISQSINQSTNQSINQSFTQSSSLSIIYISTYISTYLASFTHFEFTQASGEWNIRLKALFYLSEILLFGLGNWVVVVIWSRDVLLRNTCLSMSSGKPRCRSSSRFSEFCSSEVPVILSI